MILHCPRHHFHRVALLHSLSAPQPNTNKLILVYILGSFTNPSRVLKTLNLTMTFLRSPTISIAPNLRLYPLTAPLGHQRLWYHSLHDTIKTPRKISLVNQGHCSAGNFESQSFYVPWVSYVFSTYGTLLKLKCS